MRRSFVSVMLIVCPVLLFTGCSTENPVQNAATDSQILTAAVASQPDVGYFSLEAKYDSVGSYPGGGGVYIIRLIPGIGFSGDVQLTVDAGGSLGAVLTTSILNEQSPIAEVTISPKSKIPKHVYHIFEIAGTNRDFQQTVQLEVETHPGGSTNLEWALMKKEQCDAYLAQAHPELGDLAAMDWKPYLTYPYVMAPGAEHWTFINDQYEYRICFPVVLYDVAELWIRPRGAWDATLAAAKRWDDVNEVYYFEDMPVEDYPIKYGY